MDGSPNVDRRLGDATIVALKAIIVAWSGRIKLMDGFYRVDIVTKYLSCIGDQMELREVVLSIPQIILKPYLGLYAQERVERQEVRVSIELSFDQPLSACLSDEISDTLCYHTLFEEMNSLINDREFKLIEHLGYCLGEVVEKQLLARRLPSASVFLRLLKPKLPFDGCPEGAFFSFRFSTRG
jgi:dihydroneopterin aldolase